MRIARVVPPVMSGLIFLALWEGVCRAGWISAFLLAAPSAVFESLTNDAGELFPAFGWTGIAALSGFLISAALGILIGISLMSSRWMFRSFYPYAVVFQTVPIIAVAPLLVIWFGYGLPAVVASALLASLFPVIMATLTGLRAASPELRDLFALYRATPAATLSKLTLPMAVPSVLTGLRISAGLAVIGAIVGEFVGGGGLGSVIDSARTQQRVDKVFASVLLAAALGALFIGCIDMLNRWALARWNPRA